jgi:hypothetical protein
MSDTPTHRLRRTLDCLEAREVPAGLTTTSWATLPAPSPVVQTAAASPLSNVAVADRVAAFAAARVGYRIGGGECAHFAAEAVRAAGGRFNVFTPGVTDYVWGALVTRVTGTAGGGMYSNPAAAARPGDVIQYAGARFRDGTVAAHHTAIVAAVDGHGRVTAVYQQNAKGARYVTRDRLDLSQLVSGTVRIYRPQARAAPAGWYRFTVVNNAGPGVYVTERAGLGASTYGLAQTDTAWSYQTRVWQSSVRPVLRVGGASIAVDDGAAYEVYRQWNGALGIRRVSP